ncbi:MAG: hypothetical protein J6X85_06965 [Ruminococcus sp.]|nr:hypothetical protein [Ruminococcus sp.]
MRYSRQLRVVSENYDEATKQILEQLISIQEESEKAISLLEKRIAELEGE